MSEPKKELNDILKELHKVLDDLSVDTGVKKEVTDSVLENLKNKIKEKKEKINSIVMTSEVLDKNNENSIEHKPPITSEHELEKRVSGETNLKTTDLLSSKIENQYIEKTKQKNSDFQQLVVEHKNSVSDTVRDKEDTEKVVTESGVPTNTLKETPISVVEQPSIVQPIKNTSQNVVNTIFIYPISVPESRDIFYEQINSTLKRVCKKAVNMKPVYEISFTDPEVDLIEKGQEIINLIKSNEVKSVFIVTNETFSLDDFVSKFSNEVFMVKLIKYSELKSKSIYLDIAIDILLTLK